MSEPFLGEVKIISFNYAPRGWAFCNGQLLPINQNQALFSILGTTYGGDGRQTFGLPNLQGRIPMHFGNGFTQGQSAGEQAHTLNISEMPAHPHSGSGNTTGNRAGLANSFWAANNVSSFATGAGPNSTMHQSAIGNAGGSQPHDNMPPYLVLNFVIALQGIFPSQN